MPAFPDIEQFTDLPVQTSGGITFEYLFEDYQEQFIFRGSTSFLKARVAWADAGDFIKDVLGFTTALPGTGATSYQRTLPLEHPMITDQWCVDCKLLNYPSSSLDNANQPDLVGLGGFTTDWAIYGLSFSRLPYFVATDDQISTQTVPELFRYCTIANRPRAKEFSINSYTLELDPPTVPATFIRTPAFIMDREQDIIVTQYQVPSGSWPYTAVDNCLGRINLSAIELPLTYFGGNSYATRTYAAETLLFRGLANEITNYPGPLGNSEMENWYLDVPLVFTYRPNTWNKLPDPNGSNNYKLVRRIIAPHDPLYSTQEFAAMFKPI